MLANGSRTPLDRYYDAHAKSRGGYLRRSDTSTPTQRQTGAFKGGRRHSAENLSASTVRLMFAGNLHMCYLAPLAFTEWGSIGREVVLRLKADGSAVAVQDLDSENWRWCFAAAVVVCFAVDSSSQIT